MKKVQSLVFLIIEVGVFSALLYYMRAGLLASHHDEISIIMPILLDIAFLAVFASFGGRLAKMFGVAPMAGKIVMGIIAGPAVLGVIEPYETGVELARLAGVLFILFEAGLHFDMKLLKKNIGVATGVAFGGVFVPLVTFALLGHYAFNLEWMPAIFLGGIFTATSVGLSVEALKRAGKLNTNLGNKIVGAAVIDDILGVVILTALAKLSSGHFELNSLFILALAVVLFLIGTYMLWSMGIADKVAKYLDKHYSESSTGIYTRFFFGSLIIASAFAGIIGLEPVLGAFGIGVVLSKVDNKIKQSAWEKIEGYMHVFVGAFLVSIGTMLPRTAILSGKVWCLAILFTIVGFAGKYVVKYFFKDKKEGRLVGFAMSIRGEVGLVFVAVALANNALNETFASAALLAVILVTVLGAVLFEREILKGTDKDSLPERKEAM